MVTTALVSILALMASIPPLAEDQRNILATADDGATRDHREAAFFALLQNTAQWTGEIGDAPIRLHPDYDAMLADPDAYRGELCRIEGRIERVEPLLSPYEGVEAWFVRVENDRPVLVYVDFKDREESRLQFGRRSSITIVARFYKRYERVVDEVNGDDQPQVYATFVGAFPQPLETIAAANRPFAITDLMIPLVVILCAGFGLVWILVRRGRAGGSSSRLQRLERAPEIVEIEPGLPDDPAEALAILRDRAQNGP